MKKSVVLAFLVLTLAAAAQAVPQYINYQGVLRDNSGNLLTGTRQMMFKIYDAATGGSEKWSMTSSEVAVTNGLYSVQLGPITGADVTAGRRWLEVTVNTTTLSPRLEILAVMFSMLSDVANYAVLSGTASTAATASTASNALALGGYGVGVSGGSIVPTTDASGKLSGSVIPDANINVSHATSADYAGLTGQASNAANATTVDNNAITSNKLAPNIVISTSGNISSAGTISAETFAVKNIFARGTEEGFCVGRGAIGAGGNTVTISNTIVTPKSLIFLAPRLDGTVGGTPKWLKVKSQTESGFTVTTYDEIAGNGNGLEFDYLIINY